MLRDFKNHLREENLIPEGSTVLLAVSGGVDSMVLCELFREAGVSFGIGHCNFKLRGKDSEADKLFVKEYAKRMNIPCYTQDFDTKKISAAQRTGIQETARELRYEWLEKTRKTGNFNLIATAHHRDDSIETLLFNLIRGTGIAGLHGILPKQGVLIRPLLFAGKKEILFHAKSMKIKFREDKSNASGKYARNAIRQNLIPVLKKLNPAFDTSIAQTIQNIRQAETIYNLAVKEAWERNHAVVGEQIHILKREVGPSAKAQDGKRDVLFPFLSPFGFNASQVKNIRDVMDGPPGKKFISGSHILTVDRDVLILSPIQKKEGTSGAMIYDTEGGIQVPVELSFRIKEKGAMLKSPQHAYLDHSRLNFPLMVRRWKNGDVIYPMGMTGKKKVSDILTDNKISRPDKEKIFVLVSGNEIAWIIGMRVDRRFAAAPSTKKVFSITAK
jgi:tRNA(Ile)-lysidine synthase